MKNLLHSRKIAAAMLLILAAGIILGIALGWGVCDYRRRHKSDNFRVHLKEKFTSRLHLTPEQQQALEPLLDRWLETYRKTRQRHIDDILRNLETQRAELKPLLDGPQLELLDSLHAETVEKIKEKKR